MFSDRLHPDVEPHASGWLPEAQGHAVYWERFGNPAARPLLWLHGGPGSGCSPLQRRGFDPARWHVVFMDQRGCGRSREAADGPPQAAAGTAPGPGSNTTPALLADLERLREHLGIARWTVCGGSWGAALALAYAARHGERVEALVLRSAFLASPAETDALMSPPTAAAGHPAHPAHQAWAQWLECLRRLGCPPSAPPRQRLRCAHAAAHGADAALAQRVALAWTRNEQARQSTAVAPGASPGEPPPSPQAAERLARRLRVQSHYLLQGCFMDMPAILDALRGWAGRRPLALVHGARDGLCPPANAERIRQALGAHADALEIVGGVGHDAFAAPMLAAWRRALASVGRTLDGSRVARP